MSIDEIAMLEGTKESEEPRLYETDYPYDDLGPSRKPLPMPVHGMAIDPGIEKVVRILRFNGVETDQSCQGGEGHASPVPMVRFNGSYGDGLHAVAVLINYGYQVQFLRRSWYFEDNEITAPQWEIILRSCEPL